MKQSSKSSTMPWVSCAANRHPLETCLSDATGDTHHNTPDPRRAPHRCHCVGLHAPHGAIAERGHHGRHGGEGAGRRPRRPAELLLALRQDRHVRVGHAEGPAGEVDLGAVRWRRPCSGRECGTGYPTTAFGPEPTPQTPPECTLSSRPARQERRNARHAILRAWHVPGDALRLRRPPHGYKQCM